MMRNSNLGMAQLENGVFTWQGFGVLVASTVGLAFVIALWFTSMLFLVRGVVDAATSAPVITESGYERVMR
jgi:hypothetical protein